MALLLRQASSTTLSLHTKYADTRANPIGNVDISRLMDAISQVIGRTIIVIDHRKNIKIYKNLSRAPPLLIGCVDLSSLETHSTQSLCILKSEYGDEYSPTVPSAQLDFSFLHSQFYLLKKIPGNTGFNSFPYK